MARPMTSEDKLEKVTEAALLAATGEVLEFDPIVFLRELRIRGYRVRKSNDKPREES